jgi:DNA-binding NarL/FixJ family response regulator
MPRILVIEDEPLIAMMMMDWLDDLGFEVAGHATSNAAARDLLDSCTPDAAIVDLVLQDGESHGLVEDLARRRIPFVVVSGTVCEDGQFPLAAAVMSKPVEQERLAAVLSSTCLTRAGKLNAAAFHEDGASA